MTNDDTLTTWLDLSEQWARLYATEPRNVAARDAISAQISPLWNALLHRYTRNQLDRLWNARCAPILGREVHRDSE